MDVVRDLTLWTLRHNFYFQAVHVPGKQNNITDSLSRFQMGRFRQLLLSSVHLQTPFQPAYSVSKWRSPILPRDAPFTEH